MSVSILVVDDEADVAELFRQQFRREVRQGRYVMHFAQSAEQALGMLGGGIRPEVGALPAVIRRGIDFDAATGLAHHASSAIPRYDRRTRSSRSSVSYGPSSTMWPVSST